MRNTPLRHLAGDRFTMFSSAAALVGIPWRRRQKRQAIRLTDQEHVNTAAHRAFAGGGVSDKNCSLCATAGAINLIQGKSLWTTGMVAGALGTGDHREALGSDSDSQAAQIGKMVTALAAAAIAGTLGKPGVNGGVALTSALTWMSAFPEGTVFVLLASGSVGHHWLNAIVRGGSVDYVDYQTDKVRRGAWNLGKVSHSDRPFHGVSETKYEDSATIYAMAFRPV